MKRIFTHIRKSITIALIAAFAGSYLCIPRAEAGEMVLPLMPAPGTMVYLSAAYTPAHLQGLTIHPDNALQFDFLIDKGDGHLDNDQKKEEYAKLVKYFLASLTIPDEDQWVNLSPYEHNRIIQNNFGRTQMGRDLLSQDYFLKQITSSLMYPESGLGKLFWDKVYARAHQEFGTTSIPVNTFNKVWIVPDEAVVYESGNTAYILKSHLKVMLEEDYLSLQKHSGINVLAKLPATHALTSRIVREIILPEIEREVNEGKNFAMLRQVYSGMVLATWYKKALKESLLGKIYADKAKVKYIGQDYKANEEIYQKYLIAFKKGVYSYIKEDVDKYTHQPIARKYFSGGFDKKEGAQERVVHSIDLAQSGSIEKKLAGRDIDDARVVLGEPDQAMFNRTPELAKLRRDTLVDIIKFFSHHKKPNLIDQIVDISLRKEITTEAMVLIKNFMGVPGIGDVMDSILNQERPRGFIAELYHALYLEQEGYKILAFDVKMSPLNDIDVLAWNGKQVLCVETKNLSDVESKKGKGGAVQLIDILLRTRKHGNRLTEYGKFVNLVRARDANTVALMVGQFGQQVAEELIRQIRDHEVDVIFSLTENIVLNGHKNGVRVAAPTNKNWMAGSRSLESQREIIVRDLRAAGRAVDKKQFFYVDVFFRPYRTFDRFEKIREGTSAFSILEAISARLNAAKLGRQLKKVNGRKATKKTAKNRAMIILTGTPKPAQAFPGGIDLNAAHMDLQIKRDGHGVPLPLNQQDMARLSRIQGLEPFIIEIKPVTALPILGIG